MKYIQYLLSVPVIFLVTLIKFTYDYYSERAAKKEYPSVISKMPFWSTYIALLKVALISIKEKHMAGNIKPGSTEVFIN